MSNPNENAEDGNGLNLDSQRFVDNVIVDEFRIPVVEYETTIDHSGIGCTIPVVVALQQQQEQQYGQQHGQRRQRKSDFILDQLYRDMSINKHSIKDCLRSKKKLPCPEVMKFLQNDDKCRINYTNNSNDSCKDHNNENGNDNDNDSTFDNGNNNKTSNMNNNNHQIAPSDLSCSYYTLMEDYLNPIGIDWKANYINLSFQVLLFESISDIATAIRFVQLLLEYEVLYAEQQQQKQENDEFLSTTTTTTNVQNDFVQYIFTIIRTVTTIINDLFQLCTNDISNDFVYNIQSQEVDDENRSSSCNRNNNELYTCKIFDDDTSTIHTSIIQLSYYTFGSLIRLNEYVQVHPFLLPPLWKGLCTIVQSIETVTKRQRRQRLHLPDTVDTVVYNNKPICVLPTELLVSAFQLLSEHINDGCQQIMMSIVANSNTTTNDDYPMQYSINNEQNEFRIKIILFLLSRLTVFLHLLSDNDNIPTYIMDTTFQTLLILYGAYCPRNFAGTNTSADTTTTSPSKVTRKVCTLIENESGLSLQIGGIGRINDDTIEKKNKQSTVTTSQLLQRKVEYILLSFIGLQQSSDHNSSSGCSINVTRLITFLQTMHNFNLKMNNTTEDHHNDDEPITEINRITFLSFLEGMNSFLIKVLTEMNHTTSFNDRVDYNNVILSICQRILFTSMPLLCLYNNNNINNKFTQQSILIDQTIQIICSTILRCEIQLINNINNSSNSYRRNQFHCIILSWLHQPENNTTTNNTNNSYSLLHQKSLCLQQELTIEILYIYIISLGRLQKRLSQQCTSMNTTTTTTTNLSINKNRKKITRPIINLLIHLLFDVRTSTTFRRNIVSLVHRLLHSDNTIVVSIVQKAYRKSITSFIATFIQLTDTNIVNRKRKKRKRDKQQQIHQRYYTAADIEIITDPIVIANIHYLDHDLVCQYTSYMESIASKHTNTKRQLQRTDLITFIIVLSLMINRSTVIGGGDDTTSNSFDVKVIKLFRKVWNLCNDRLTTKYKDCNYCNLLSLCGKRVSQLISCIVQKPNIFTLGSNNNNPIMDRINGFLTFSIISNVQEAIRKPTKHPLLFDLLFESINVLSTCSIGTIINLATNNQLQMNIIEMWRNHILSSTLWPIRHYAMSKFIISISTVPSPKGNFAIDCVPPYVQSLLQTRIQKIIDDKSKFLWSILQSDYENVLTKIDVQQFTTSNLLECKGITSTSIGTLGADQQNHPIVNSYWIEEGSYVMKMPTQDGRSAIVIFPPNDQSLNDISTLMGTSTVYHEEYGSQKSNDHYDTTHNSQDNDEQKLEQPSTIQILCRSKSYNDNGGCQLWLQPLKKRVKK